MKDKKQLFILLIPVLIILAGIIILIFMKKDRKDQNVFVGIFETTEIRVASEIPGRIDKIYVHLGDVVEKGQLLATIESDILDAKVQQAKGMYTAAESQKEKADRGARKQQVQAAKDQYEMAKGQFEFADKSYNRLLNMYKDSLISTQQMDEVTFKRNAARDQMNAAKSIYEMAMEGARVEDKKAARGQLSAVEGKVKEAEAFYKELKITAPVSGEISGKMAEESEVMPAGYPIFTIQIPEAIHAVLNVREDQLYRFAKGTEISGKLPAFENSEYRFKVTYIAPVADFADWLPTADKGRLDMKTFEVHLSPVEPIKGLRPGMSINIKF